MDKTIKSGRHRSPQPNADEHSTTRATRQSETSSDVHATGKVARSSHQDEGATVKGPRRFEQKEDKTMRGRVSAGEAKPTASGGWPSEFELDGKKYKNEGVLSDSSGEAIVFTVSRSGKKYALKLYYYDPEHRPNHTILEKIKGLSGSGLLVNIVSHGVWINPERSEEKLDYELMDFCEGGSLDGVLLAGDEKTLAEVAVRMASAIDFLAKHGILHRDIKPANFFYADKARTQIVLADFGISVECKPGETVKIDEMRSPVYAAPEFYTNVPGEPAEVGVESDYFSLGVALLALWMGKERLSANESQLLRHKLNEALPMPKDMSAHTASLIKALTRLKMSDRATFDDIRRWAKGETLSSEQSADTGFRVVFNSSKNQIANCPAELAHFLLEDPTLGKKYLYSGRVTRWLEETGKNELAVNIEEIVEKVYPSNQQAGLMASVYLLDPAQDYISPDGTQLSDPVEIGHHLFENRFDDELMDFDSNLYIFLRARKLDRLADAMKTFINEDESSYKEMTQFKSMAYFNLLVDPHDSFPVDVEEGWEYVDDLDELFEVLHRTGKISPINQELISGPLFVTWLSFRHPELAGKVRMLLDNANDDVESEYYNSGSAYRIIYELNPRLDLFFGTDTDDPNRLYTIPEIGAYLAGVLNELSLGSGELGDFMNTFVNMDSHQVGDFLRSRGDAYSYFLEWNRYCMDVEGGENDSKAGPYDAVIGAYRSVAGFLQGAPGYTIGDIVVRSPEELKSIPVEQIKPLLGDTNVRSMPAGDGKPVAWLDAWLTIFFQEKPMLDLSEPFTYEKETAKYTEYIGQLDKDNKFYRRYRKGIRQIDKSASKLHKSERSLKTKRTIFTILGIIPTLIMLIASWFLNAPDGNPISGHFMTTWGICMVGFWIIGSTIFDSISGGFFPGLIGGLVAAALAYAGFAWFPSVLYLICGIILFIGAIIAMKYMFMREKVDTGGLEIKGNEFEYRQLDALYFAYRLGGDKMDNVVTEFSEAQRSQDEVTRENIGTVGGMWVPVVCMIFLIWYFATPQLSRHNAWIPMAGVEKPVPGKWVLGKWVAKYGSGSTRIVCNIDSVDDGKTIYGTMEIAGQAPVKAVGTVSSRHDTIPESFSFHVKDAGFNKQEFSARVNTVNKQWESYYYDRKEIMHQTFFVSTPLDSPQASPANTKPASKKTTTKKSEKIKPTDASASSTETVETSSGNSNNEEQSSTGNILGEDTLY